MDMSELQMPPQQQYPGPASLLQRGGPRNVLVQTSSRTQSRQKQQLAMEQAALHAMAAKLQARERADLAREQADAKNERALSQREAHVRLAEKQAQQLTKTVVDEQKKLWEQVQRIKKSHPEAFMKANKVPEVPQGELHRQEGVVSIPQGELQP